MEQLKFLSVCLSKLGSQFDLAFLPIITSGTFESVLDYYIGFIKRSELDINFRKNVRLINHNDDKHRSC
jgi:hypothetical protein